MDPRPLPTASGGTPHHKAHQAGLPTPSCLKQPSVLSAGEGSSDGRDTVFVLPELWCSEGNKTEISILGTRVHGSP